MLRSCDGRVKMLVKQRFKSGLREKLVKQQCLFFFWQKRTISLTSIKNWILISFKICKIVIPNEPYILLLLLLVLLLILIFDQILVLLLGLNISNFNFCPLEISFQLWSSKF
jgi:hypothetical protein